MELKDSDAAKSADSATAAKGVDGKPPVDAKDAKGSESSAENLPWHKDERFKVFLGEKKSLEAANAKLQKLLKDNDLDDPDDLEDLVKSGKVVRGKIADLNSLDDLLAKSAKLDSYEAYWADQKKKQQRETEDPTERADRLERELDGEKGRKRFEENQKRQMEQTKQAISNYEKEVQNLISEIGVPKEQSPFILELFGVGNPSNDVDITDRKAIKKLVTDGVKRLDAFKQSVIADYLKEKKGIVKTGQGSEAVTGEKPVKTNLKTMRKSLHEQMSSLYRGAM